MRLICSRWVPWLAHCSAECAIRHGIGLVQSVFLILCAHVYELSLCNTRTVLYRSQHSFTKSHSDAVAHTGTWVVHRGWKASGNCVYIDSRHLSCLTCWIKLAVVPLQLTWPQAPPSHEYTHRRAYSQNVTLLLLLLPGISPSHANGARALVRDHRKREKPSDGAHLLCNDADILLQTRM